MDQLTQFRSPQAFFSRTMTLALSGLFLIIASAGVAQAQWGTSGTDIYNTNSGKVGVGTTSPALPVDVRGASLVSGDLRAGIGNYDTTTMAQGVGGGIQFGGKFDSGGSIAGFASISGIKENATNNDFASALVFTTRSNGANQTEKVRINSNGNVGVGTTSPASILTVQTTGTDNGGDKYVRIKSTNSYSGLLLDPGQAGDAGWLILGGYPNAGDFTVREYGVANYFTIKKSTGNVGIGTSAPGYSLDVQGNAQWVARFKKTDATNGGIIVDAAAGYNPNIALSVNGATKWYLNSNTSNGDKLQFWESTGATPRFTITQSGTVGIGTPTPSSSYKLDVYGDTNVTGSFSASGTITGGTIVAKYQDVAEWVPASRVLPAGTVVTLDPTKSNHVEASSHAYDTRVAGVVSEQPGITLGESGENKVLVATTGRVRVTVDASHAPIHIGDLLVTSNLPGVAMKSEAITIGGRQIHSPGTLIGKALEPLEKGSGKILVLLSLQ